MDPTPLRRARLCLRGLRRRYLPKSEAAFSQVDVLVFSPGGVGTTLLIQELGRYVRVNRPHDRDGLKHLPTPRNLPARVKVVFVTGAFDSVCQSLERRGFLPGQLAKLGSPLGPLLPKARARAALRALVKRQKQAWSRLPPSQILFVDYDEL